MDLSDLWTLVSDLVRGPVRLDLLDLRSATDLIFGDVDDWSFGAPPHQVPSDRRNVVQSVTWRGGIGRWGSESEVIVQNLTLGLLKKCT